MHRIKTRRPIRRRPAGEEEEEDKNEGKKPPSTPSSKNSKDQQQQREGDGSPPPAPSREVLKANKTRQALKAKLAARNAPKFSEDGSGEHNGNGDTEWISFREDMMQLWRKFLGSLQDTPYSVLVVVILILLSPIYSFDTGLIVSNTINMFRPERFHSGVKSGPYFEGWYIKTTNPETNESLVFIPGFYLPRSPRNSTALVYDKAQKRRKSAEAAASAAQSKASASDEDYVDNEPAIDWDDTEEWPTDLRAELIEARRADHPAASRHAFIMVFRSSAPEPQNMLYYRYDPSQFQVLKEAEAGGPKFGFQIRIGNSVFGHDGVKVNLSPEDLVLPDPENIKQFFAKALKERKDTHPNVVVPSISEGHLLSVDRADFPLSITGELKFKDNVRLPSTWWSPTVMGYFTYLPFLECYHGLVSQHHYVTGSVSFKRADDTLESLFKIENGDGYIEKDWGYNFPKAWIWLHTNTFPKEKGSSLMISVADIPLLAPQNILYRAVKSIPFIGPRITSRLRISGYLVILHHARTNTTYNLGLPNRCSLRRINISVEDGSEGPNQSIDAVFTCSKSTQNVKLTVRATRILGTGIPLMGPNVQLDRMAPIVEETVDANIAVKLEDEFGKVIFDDIGFMGGIELNGNIGSLLTGWK